MNNIVAALTEKEFNIIWNIATKTAEDLAPNEYEIIKNRRLLSKFLTLIEDYTTCQCCGTRLSTNFSRQERGMFYLFVALSESEVQTHSY